MTDVCALDVPALARLFGIATQGKSARDLCREVTDFVSKAEEEEESEKEERWAIQNVHTDDTRLASDGTVLVRVSWQPTCVDARQKVPRRMAKRIESARRVYWNDTYEPASQVLVSDLVPPKELVEACPLATEKRDYVSTPPIFADRGFPASIGSVASAPKSRKAVLRVLPAWKNAKDELQQFWYVDNPGGGDCFYYALAPMIKALKPSLFNGTNDMLRLRTIIASRVPADFDELLGSYDSHALRKIYQQRFAGKRDALQQYIMSAQHWGSLPDIGLLSNALGDDVVLLVLGSAGGIFCVGVPQAIIEGADDSAARYILIAHAAEHFGRLEQRDTGQFAFTGAELRERYPKIWQQFRDSCIASDISRAVLRLITDILERYPHLQKYTKTSDGKDRSYDFVIYDLLGVSRDTPDVDAVLVGRAPGLVRYLAMSAAEQRALQDALVYPRVAETFKAADVGSNA